MNMVMMPSMTVPRKKYDNYSNADSERNPSTEAYAKEQSVAAQKGRRVCSNECSIPESCPKLLVRDVGSSWTIV